MNGIDISCIFLIGFVGRIEGWRRGDVWYWCGAAVLQFYELRNQQLEGRSKKKKKIQSEDSGRRWVEMGEWRRNYKVFIRYASDVFELSVFVGLILIKKLLLTLTVRTEKRNEYQTDFCIFFLQ